MAGNLNACGSKLSCDSSDEEDHNGEDKGEIDIGLSLEKLNLGPQKNKLLVLSLSGLLVKRVHRSEEPKPTNRDPDAVAGNFQLFKRPYCNEFLNFCFERFHVGLWSSARERNIDNVLTTVMRGFSDKLLFVWDQQDCSDYGFMSLEKADKPLFFKELTKVWNNPARLKERAQFSASNTLMIDDKPYKALLNPPGTAIFPFPYKLDDSNDTVLGPKGELRMFLDGLADAKDVPTYVKGHPIGQPAITEQHSDWNFYSKVIQQRLLQLRREATRSEWRKR